MYDGTLKFDTALDAEGLRKGMNGMDSIVKGAAVFKTLEAGFRVVVNSIDDAVSRYDTLNRFPKVLENMGYSAQASAAATEKLSDGVQGLPTKLDEIVSTAQRLTVLTGNLESSTDTALALNNAFYASGSAAADASRGLTQYIQMLSTGKVDIVSWRTLQETMGYALSKTADAFGFAGESAQSNLYAALRDGEITFTQFNAKLIELNDGVGGFAEMARTSTGGIGTAWTNLQTGIVRGTASIVEAIDSGLSQTRFKSIENTITTAGRGINSTLQGVASVAGIVASNLDTLAISAVGVGTAFGAYKAINTWRAAAEKAAAIATKAKNTHTALTLSVGKHTHAELELAAATAKEAAAAAAAEARKAKQNATTLAAVAAEAKERAARVSGIAAQEAQTASVQAHVAANNAAITAKVAETKAQTANTAAKAANKALQDQQNASMSLGTALVGYLTGSFSLQTVAIAAATAATTLFSMALKALPLVGIASAIGAVVAGVIALVKWIGDSNAAYNDGMQYIKDYKAANEELAASFDETTKSYNENRNAAEATARVSREMLADLQELANKGFNRTTEETNRLQAKINALNAAQEGLNLTIDETTGKLSMSTEAIEAYFAATESAAKNKALQDHMKALSEQLVEVQTSLVDAERELAQWEDQFENGELSPEKYHKLTFMLEKEMEGYAQTQSDILDEMAANEEAYTQFQAEQEAARQELITLQEDEIRAFAEKHHLSFDEIMADMDENKLSFDEWVAKNQEGLDSAQEDIAEFAEKWGLSFEDVDAAITASGLTVQEYLEQQDAALEHAKEVVSDYTSSTTDGFSVMEQESAISLDKFMANMQKNQEATANWAANMNTLMDLGINQGVIEQLAKMGPAGAAQAQAFVDELTQMNGGVDLALGQTNEAVAAKLAEIDDTFNTSLETANAAADAQLRAESYYEAGYASIDRIATGIAENTSATDAATEAGSSIAESMSVAIETVDFSSTGQEIGNSIIASTADAVRNGTRQITSAANGLDTSVQNVFKNMSSQAQSHVKIMMSSIASTITIRSSAVKSSTTSCADGVIKILSDMKTRGESLAIAMMSGINLAIVTRAANVKSSATATANGIVSALQAMVSGGTNAANNMMDGMLSAMHAKAVSLYAKAEEIADNISQTLRAAWDEHSPSRVSYQIMRFFMLAMYNAMDDMSDLLYRETEDIADGIVGRLAFSPSVIDSLHSRIQAISETGLYNNKVLAPAMAAASGNTTTIYESHQSVTVVSPEPMSEYELSRELEDQDKRRQWRIH